MGRRARSVPSPAALGLRRDRRARLEYKLRVVTPQLGGAAAAGEPNTGVRSASVANALRRWWRVLNAPAFLDAGDLFVAEAVLWGSTDRQSLCRVEVVVDQAGTIERTLNTYPQYALFPLDSVKDPRVVKGIEFTVWVAVPADRRDEVDAAVRAFVAFGGVGARTRRGCGSLALRDGTLTLPSDVAKSVASTVTTLPSELFLGDRTNDPVVAWSKAVDVYREFRQEPGFARNIGQTANRPGRSRFPEADTLRRLTHRHGHEPEHPVSGYPRADLGLPIVFQFTETEKEKKNGGEPPGKILQGRRVGHRRFASPVITKALAVDGTFRPMVMILNSPHVWQDNPVELVGVGPLSHVRTDVSAAELELTEAQRLLVGPLAGAPIREALATYVQGHGFTRQTL